MTGAPADQVRFGLAVPASIGGFATGLDDAPGAVSDVGVDEWLDMLTDPSVASIWALDQLAGKAPTPEAFSVLSFLAARTTTQRLGIAVLIGAGRGPVATAKAVTTLDWLSRGRVDLGLGLGAGAHYPSYGVDRQRGGGMGSILDELIHLTRRLWTEDSVTADGATWQFHDVRMNPKPLQHPHPPVWIGGGGTRALERALDLGAGYIGAGRHSSQEFLDHVEQLRALAEVRGGLPAGFGLAKRVYLVVADRREDAESTVRNWFDRFYGWPDLGAQVTVFGTVDECAAELAELVAAGATELIIHPLIDRPEQYRRVVTDVMPATLALR